MGKEIGATSRSVQLLLIISGAVLKTHLTVLGGLLVVEGIPSTVTATVAICKARPNTL